MKKKERIFGGILLAVFIVALALFFRLYLTENREYEEETEDELFIKTPKQFYEFGENMEVQGLIINVSEAELTEDYEKINSFYKERGFIQSPEEYVKTYIEAKGNSNDLMPGDVRFFRIKCSVRNIADKKSDFYPDSLYPTSIIGSAMYSWNFQAYDISGISESDGKRSLDLEGKKPEKYEKNSQKRVYTMQPGEVIEIEVVGEFQLCDIYTAYSAEDLDGTDNSYNLFLMMRGSTKRVCLNISGSFDDKGRTYPKARNIQKMKCEAWTNLEWTQWQKNRGVAGRYRLEETAKQVIEKEDAGQEFVELLSESMLSNEIVYTFSLVTTLTNFEIMEWKDLPSDFSEQENLQKMAQRYHSVYNCKEENLKVLILDLNYTTRETGENYYNSRKVNNFYQRSRLYVKDEKGDLCLFGTADDWIVTENNVHPENIGSVNMESMGADDTISVRMAYILPPQLYQEYSALYFTGGNCDIIFNMKEISITKIKI